MDNYAPNGYFHPIDHVLTYNDEVRQNVLNERLRYSPVAFIPELFSVKKSPRGDGGGDVGYCPFDYFKKSIKWEGLPQNNKGIRTTSGLNWLAHKKGFALTLPLLPVPYAGMWEIRLRLNNDPTQLVQFHFGSSPRISEMKYIDTRPLDIPQLYTYTNVGQSVKRIIEYPSDRDLLYDSLLCMEIDQRLKALGWMRIPKYPDDGYYAYDRYCYQGRRMILTRQYMEPDKTYYLRMQWKTGAGWKESELDFFELVPKSVYDNPYRTKDVW